MKKILLIGAAFAGLALVSLANIPTYRSFTGAGLAASPAFVVLPADPNSQIRLVSIAYRSDTNNGFINMSSGTTAYSLVYSNTTSSAVTNIINSTNGLTPGGYLILQHNGTDYTNTIVTFGNTGTGTFGLAGFGLITNAVTTMGALGQGPAGQAATNVNFVVTTATGWGYLAVPGDDLYLMGAISSLFTGATTNSVNGDDIFSGNYGRPVLVMFNLCLGSNHLDSVSAHYDSASQN